MFKSIYFLFFLLLASSFYAQGNEDLEIRNARIAHDQELVLAPAKAAFYSTILPGLGQAYNKKYWKIPIIYGALGTSIYFYSRNNDNYNRVLDALKLELQDKPHEFEFLDVAGLENAVSDFKKDRDLALFVSVGIYVLNILEANVDAHLPDKKLNDSLSFQPNIFISPITNEISYGISLNIKFN